MGLIMVTIAYEKGTEYLEDNVFNNGIALMLFQKMV